MNTVKRSSDCLQIRINVNPEENPSILNPGEKCERRDFFYVFGLNDAFPKSSPNFFSKTSDSAADVNRYESKRLRYQIEAK